MCLNVFEEGNVTRFFNVTPEQEVEEEAGRFYG